MDQAVDASGEGATVVITHRVKEGMHDVYNQWLSEIGPVCKTYKGYLDWQIIRPISESAGTYSVVVRFDSKHNLDAWLNSSARKELIAKIQPALVGDDHFFVRSGLDFWFVPEGAKAQIPFRWKQFLVTWSAIFPLSVLMPIVSFPLFRIMGIPENHYLRVLLISGEIVFLMVYLIMPRYTRLIHKWLFKQS